VSSAVERSQCLVAVGSCPALSPAQAPRTASESTCVIRKLSECACWVRGRKEARTESLLLHASTQLMFNKSNFIIRLIYLQVFEMPWVCCGSRVCSSWCVGALVGRLLHVCAMCTMCTFLACWWCRVCSSSQHPQQTQHAKCVGGKATTHAPAHRGAQLNS